ncbi:MAG: DinB family protein [Bacteroidota bacterium]
MLPPLQQRFDALERRRTIFLDTLGSLTPEVRQREPSPGAWSLNELMHHLVLVDSGMVRSIQYYLDKPPRTPDSGSWMKVLGMRVFFALPTRVRVPAQVQAIVPSDTPDFETLAQQWDAARTDLRATLEAVSHERLKTAAFKHPLSGRMSLLNAVAFIGWHHDHHRAQLRRTLKAVAPD